VAGERVTVRSTTLLTTEANEEMSAIHDRMPVILPARAWDEWLDPTNLHVERLQPLLVPAPTGILTMHPVSTEVNNARNEGAHLVDEIPADAVVGAEDGVQETLL
jgi:putative SOS response-associated peptidase YedK